MFASSHRPSRVEIDELVRAGAAGQPTRVALVARGSARIGCDCPPFLFDEGDLGPVSDVLPVSVGGIVSPRMDRFDLRFIIVGYYSGAQIDALEYLGIDAAPASKEDAYALEELHPEFCLEAWCYGFDPAYAPIPISPTERPSDTNSIAASDAAALDEMGVPRCEPTWFPHR